MADKEFDPWKLSTGLADEYTGTITDAYFAFDDDYNDGDTLVLKLEIQTDDPDLGDSGTVTELYPCGPGWEPRDKGATARREDGKNKAFNVNSGVGLLVGSAMDTEAADVLRERAGASGPMNAGIWKGLKFAFQRFSKEFTPRDGGEKRTYSRMLVTEFHGVQGGKASASTAKPAAEEAQPAAVGAEGGAIPAKVKIALKKLAKECDTHEAFMEQAFIEVEGVDGNPAVEAAVMDDSDTSIYATSRA